MEGFGDQAEITIREVDCLIAQHRRPEPSVDRMNARWMGASFVHTLV
jgi:hypothetical protein